MEKTFTIKAAMEERWIPHFLNMLDALQKNGAAGHSGVVGMYADGDGDFRPKSHVDMYCENVEPSERTCCKIDAVYDAGQQSKRTETEGVARNGGPFSHSHNSRSSCRIIKGA